MAANGYNARRSTSNRAAEICFYARLAAIMLTTVKKDYTGLMLRKWMSVARAR